MLNTTHLGIHVTQGHLKIDRLSLINGRRHIFYYHSSANTVFPRPIANPLMVCDLYAYVTQEKTFGLVRIFYDLSYINITMNNTSFVKRLYHKIGSHIHI